MEAYSRLCSTNENFVWNTYFYRERMKYEYKIIDGVIVEEPIDSMKKRINK